MANRRGARVRLHKVNGCVREFAGQGQEVIEPLWWSEASSTPLMTASRTSVQFGGPTKDGYRVPGSS